MKHSDIVAGLPVVTTVNLLHVPVGTSGKIAANRFEGAVEGSEHVLVNLGKGFTGSLYYDAADLQPA